MKQLVNVVNDRGSKYAVSGCDAHNKADALNAVKTVCLKKKFAKATHNTWAVILSNGEQLKHDDGESGASGIILKMLHEKKCINHIVIVTRWYGGVHLGGDRFRHIKTCVNAYFKHH